MTHEHYLQAWQESQELAEAMQPLIGRLYRQQGVEITLYGRPLQNASTIDILKAHRVVRRHQGAPLPIQQSFPLLQAIVALKPTAAEVDLGKLAVGYWRDHQDEAGLETICKRDWHRPLAATRCRSRPTWCSTALAVSAACWPAC